MKCGSNTEKLYIHVFPKQIYIYSVHLESIGNFSKAKKKVGVEWFYKNVHTGLTWSLKLKRLYKCRYRIVFVIISRVMNRSQN